MILNGAYKFRLYPTLEQQEFFARTFGCCRFIWNRMLADRIQHYEKTKESLMTTPAGYKKEFEFLQEVPGNVLCNVQINLQKAFSNFFRGKGKIGFPKFKSKKSSRNVFTVNYLKFVDGKLKLQKLRTLIKTKMHRPIPENHLIKSATISRTASGKYFISILTEYEVEIVEKKIEDAIGLDFSMSKLYVDSNGDDPVNGNPEEFFKFYKKSQQKLAIEQRKLSKMIRGSNNYKFQKIKIARIHEHIANQRKNFLHNQSKQITNEFDAICVEGLNMQSMSQCLNFGKSVTDNSWGSFVEMLRYKLESQGKHLIKIDKWFPSSKMCSRCGATKEMPLGEQIYTCDACGLVIDRDHNAAKNILKEGLRTFFENCSNCGDRSSILEPPSSLSDKHGTLVPCS